MSHDYVPSDSEQPNKPTAAYEPNVMRSFMYDPSRVPTLTAEELSRVEDDIYREGVTQEQGQEMIYRKLESMGLNLRDLQNGAIVVDFVGADGKADRRAMVVDYSDFGTRVAGANLIEEESEQKEDAADNEEQEHLLEAALLELKSKVDGVESRIEGASYATTLRRQAIDDEMSPLRSELVGLRLGGEMSSSRMQQLVNESLPNAYRYASDLATEAGDEQRIVRSLVEDDVEQARSEGRNLDEGRRSKLDAVLRTSESAFTELKLNRDQSLNAMSGVVDTIDQIARVVNEMLASRSGHEYYASHLGQLIDTMDSQVARSRQLAHDVAQIIADIKKSLS